MGDLGEATAWVDVYDSNIPIVLGSTGFTIFGPITDGASLLDMISSDANKFKVWLQDSVNKFTNAEQTHPCKVRLRTTLQARVEFTSTCILDDGDADEMLFRLVFKNVKCKRKERSENRG